MLKLVEEKKYSCGDFIITVEGLDCDVLSLIHPICAAMDKKVKGKLLDIAKDSELSQLLMKSQNGEQLSSEEQMKIAAYLQENSDEFSLEDCKKLLDNFKNNISLVVDSEGQDVTVDFKNEVVKSPKYLKSLANIAYAEYKDATEVAVFKKV